MTAWGKTSPANEALKREVEVLFCRLVRTQAELRTARAYAGRLEYLLRRRTETNDELHGTIDQLREQNRRLDAEADRLAEMVRLAP
jgi:hypothetical protein